MSLNSDDTHLNGVNASAPPSASIAERTVAGEQPAGSCELLQSFELGLSLARISATRAGACGRGTDSRPPAYVSAQTTRRHPPSSSARVDLNRAGAATRCQYSRVRTGWLRAAWASQSSMR